MEKNGIGNEYDDYKLVFEGEYLNGKRNGKGTEFGYYGKLEFEGEYKEGKRNGKGKEYDPFNGKLIFEGEYLNGEKYKLIFSKLLNRIYSKNNYQKFLVYNNKKYLNKLLSKR